MTDPSAYDSGRIAPVVLIVFNRPDLTSEAVQRLARIRPPHVMVIADGPRDSVEQRLCDKTLAAVREGITWPARVEWCVSDTNLGCSERVLTGLDWVFERVAAAIILEDDIEVADEFFDYATDALRRWQEADVAAISARNELITYSDSGREVLARRGNVWGWATWAQRWQDFRGRFDEEFDGLGDLLPRTEAPLLSRIHAHMLGRREWETSGVWDIAWTLWLMTQGLRTVIPPVNMAANHGFRPDGTHTSVTLDLRGKYPLLDLADARIESPDFGVDGERGAAYDEIVSLLDLMMLYAQPRRWRLMAAHAERTGAPVDGAMELMLEPWRRRSQSRAALDHLARYVSSPHLTELRAVFT